MKTLFLTSAVVLTLALGSAPAATTDEAPQNHQQVAMNAQASGVQARTSDGQSYRAMTDQPHVGGWEPLPPDSMSSGGG